MVLETARQIAGAIRAGDTTVTEVTTAALDRIRSGNDAIYAFHTISAELALAQASALDQRRADWPAMPLLGVPIALKDNLCTRGVTTTAGSRILADYVPPYNATVVDRLINAGAVIVGKTNCDEFAMGSSTENSAFAPTRNPWALDRTPGGSSGGSAAAVAARMVPIALGSDTGGSIRQPAALCGVVGLKPTYGRVSRFGLIAFASSLDQIGPITTSVEDAAAALDVMAGPDPRDATCATAARPGGGFVGALTGDIRGARIGVPRALVEEGVDGGVRTAFARALETLTALGAAIVDVALPYSVHAIPVYYLVATAEASSNLARYDGVRYGFRAAAAALGEMYDRTRDAGFGAEVKRRVLLGTYVLSSGYYDAYYLKAQQVRTLIRRDYDTALASVDLVAMPTSPTPAFKLGERTSDPLQMYLADVFTVGANLAGLPAISLPCGLTAEGLPCGLQLTGRAMDEATVLRVADVFEKAAGFNTARPPRA
ncbi:MAG TPA: Asp-tRNA(Asn)/Glu-tRNA(Gln) amidotransferase subunit GatA [Vicinamibacterales bacterium]|nr:Asp-tRNA(Asn)/Glu-tRNA(Gln) amidotransferase subunit GatA [Vicinamibacterales bacterium]